jgi:hypothetical protein
MCFTACKCLLKFESLHILVCIYFVVILRLVIGVLNLIGMFDSYVY